MTKIRLTLAGLASISILLLAFTTGYRYYNERLTKEIPASNESELKVNVEAGFGNFSISRGPSTMIMKAEVEKNKNFTLDDCISYKVRDEVGYLSISTDCQSDEERDSKKKKSIHFDGIDAPEWNIQLADALPISFDGELGLGKADIDLTGLSIREFNLSTGASSVRLRIDHPNDHVIDDVNIEAGLCKFSAEGLGNLNFRHLRFEGGVGAYSLDFSGDLKKEVDVDIEVGLGSLTIYLPEELGAKIWYEKSWIAHLEIDNDVFEEIEEDSYFSSNYATAKGKVNFNIEAGLGNVKIMKR